MLSGNETIGIESGVALEASIASATHALLDCQRPDGHWVFELEADCTIPADYVLLRHYLGEPVDTALEAKIAVYLRRVQGAHGGDRKSTRLNSSHVSISYPVFCL